jgi:ATP-dependent RNA helicase RhlE
VLVFTRTKHGANRLAQQLEANGIRSAAIHGNKSQGARVRALADFKDNKVTALVATEVAARGLDIKELPHVVNYELPNVPEDYVHRIGRTARAGGTGFAVSLVAPDEGSLLRDIERVLRRSIPVAALPEYPIGVSPAGSSGEDRPPRRQGEGRHGGGRNGGGAGRNGSGGSGYRGGGGRGGNGGGGYRSDSGRSGNGGGRPSGNGGGGDSQRQYAGARSPQSSSGGQANGNQANGNSHAGQAQGHDPRRGQSNDARRPHGNGNSSSHGHGRPGAVNGNTSGGGRSSGRRTGSY